MLSRSNSTAGERLRRAKSNSSGHTSSSDHQRYTDHVDPFVAQRHAEVAAVEAYRRATKSEQLAYQAYRPPPPRLQRRKSQTTGRVEGSHFEDSRLGARVSIAPKSAIPRNRSTRELKPITESKPPSRAVAGDDERIVVRKRCVIQPSFSYGTSSSPAQDVLPTSSASRHVRKVQSMYGTGSPTSRSPAVAEQLTSAANVMTPSRAQNDPYGNNLSRLSDFRYSADITVMTTHSQRGSIRETQTDEDIVALARDRCLQDFHQKKVRQRKSFIYAPFQKLRSKSSALQSSEISYDTSLPPFNYANEADLAPLRPAPSPPLPAKLTKKRPANAYDDPKESRKSRVFSGAWKNTFRKAFRRASQAPSGMPLQHIESKHPHFTVNGRDTSADIAIPDEPELACNTTDATTTATPVNNVADLHQVNSTQDRQSVSEIGTAESRVTSWNDSTIAGTLTTRNGSEHISNVDEHGGLQRSNTASTLKRTGSFFGNPVRSLIRRASRATIVRRSGESDGLYSALQEQIKPAIDVVPQDPTSDKTGCPKEDPQRYNSSRDTLPSQRQRASSGVSSTNRWAAQTIRSVTPDPNAYKLSMPSPIEEVFSPVPGASDGRVTPLQPWHAPLEEPSPDDTPTASATSQTRLQRRLAKKISTPSHTEIARRIERSKNRWHAPLEEDLPALSCSARAAMVDDSPHELRPLTRTVQRRQPEAQSDHITQQQSSATTSIACHEHVRPPATVRNVISPSVYSRATNDSPRPDTPFEDGGLSVLITGHEVKRYSLSPEKPAHTSSRAIKTSRDWRAWLSKELTEFDAASSGPEDLTLTHNTYDSSRLGIDTPPLAAEENGQFNARNAEDSDLEHMRKTRKTSTTSPPATTTAIDQQRRPEPRSRRSSYMNERYPILESDRKSSDKSIKTLRNLSAEAEGRSSSTEPTSNDSTKTPSTNHKSADTTAAPARSILDRRRPVLKPRSSTCFEPYSRSKSALGPCTLDTVRAGSRNAQNVADATATPTLAMDDKATGRPKSAFDLRANYKSMAGATKAVNIRRKPVTSTLVEDDTIRRISAGPYASQPPSVCNVGANKENTPPSSETSMALPALSSSEWLGGGSGPRKVTSRVENRMSSVYRPASRARTSPTRNVSLYPSPNTLFGKGSPGQNMATEYLDRRKKEESPAFM